MGSIYDLPSICRLLTKTPSLKINSIKGDWSHCFSISHHLSSLQEKMVFYAGAGNASLTYNVSFTHEAEMTPCGLSLPSVSAAELWRNLSFTKFSNRAYFSSELSGLSSPFGFSNKNFSNKQGVVNQFPVDAVVLVLHNRGVAVCQMLPNRNLVVFLLEVVIEVFVGRKRPDRTSVDQKLFTLPEKVVVVARRKVSILWSKFSLGWGCEFYD